MIDLHELLAESLGIAVGGSAGTGRRPPAGPAALRRPGPGPPDARDLRRRRRRLRERRRLRLRGALMTATVAGALDTPPLDAGRLDTLVTALRGVLGEDQILTAKTDRWNRARVPAPFPVHRWSERVPDVVVLPTSTEQVAAVVRIANDLRVPVVPRDGGTGLTDGAVPLRRGIVVDVKRMNQIHELDLVNRTVTVGTGINMLKLNERLAQHGLFYPDDPASYPCSLVGRADRDQRLVADRLALRAHPRPGAQLRPRAADRGRAARRRRDRREDQQELERLPAQAPVHGPPGHAGHRDPGDAQAVPQARGRAVAVLGVRQLRRRLRLHRRAGPRRGGDVRRRRAVRRAQGRLPAARRRGLHPAAGRRPRAGLRGHVRLRRRGARRREAAVPDRPGARRPLPRRRDLRGRLGRPARPLRHAAARPDQGRPGHPDVVALRGRRDQLLERPRRHEGLARDRRRPAAEDRRLRRLGHVRLHVGEHRRGLPHRDRRRHLGAAPRRRGVGGLGGREAADRRGGAGQRRLDLRLPRVLPRGRGRPRARRSWAAAST